RMCPLKRSAAALFMDRTLSRAVTGPPTDDRTNQKKSEGVMSISGAYLVAHHRPAQPGQPRRNSSASCETVWAPSERGSHGDPEEQERGAARDQQDRRGMALAADATRVRGDAEEGDRARLHRRVLGLPRRWHVPLPVLRGGAVQRG